MRRTRAFLDLAGGERTAGTVGFPIVNSRSAIYCGEGGVGRRLKGRQFSRHGFTEELYPAARQGWRCSERPMLDSLLYILGIPGIWCRNSIACDIPLCYRIVAGTALCDLFALTHRLRGLDWFMRGTQISIATCWEH